MEEFKKLIVVAESATVGQLPFLAQSMGFMTEVIRDDQQLALLDTAGTLVAISIQGMRLDKYTMPIVVKHALQFAPVFLYRADEQMVDQQVALISGIRGVISADKQLDQVLHALKILMQGELYYGREQLSILLDKMLKFKRQANDDSASAPCLLQLTRQEKRIIELVGEGARNKEIATHLNISAHTVKAHLSSIFRKTQSRNRVELLRWAQQFHAAVDTVI
ncbi:LuxR C-terminal-related transcriptional regulator [Shewanella sp. A3A]|nr:LuxR C-terminal-related transcriptional regulator [Shewanella ferrihydritica]